LNTTLVTSHSLPLSGLMPGTPYHYRVKSRDIAGNLAISGDTTFTTSAPLDTQPPTVPGSLVVSGTTATSLTLNWAASTDNVGVSGYRLDVSTASSFSSFVAGYNNKDVGNVTSTVASGLVTGSTYYARVRAYDAAGNVSPNSATVQGSTDVSAPVISAVQASSISVNKATITWTTNEPADSRIDYGLTSSYGQSTSLDSTMVTSHSQRLSGLAHNQLYHYRVKSKDAAGNLTTSGDFTFTTGS
jgi:hypothetical protein